MKIKSITRLTASICGIAGMLGVAEAQLVDAQRVGIDFSNSFAAPTNDFILYTPAAGAVAVSKDVTGAAVTGSVTVSCTLPSQNADAVANGGEDPVFDASNLEDWMGFPASGSITFAGLDDALEYELVIGSGFVNENGRATFTADGQSVSTSSLAANPFGTLSGLETDGSGNLVISLSADVAVCTVSACTLLASTPVVIPNNVWQTDGNGSWSDIANWNPAVPNAASVLTTFDSTLPLTGPLTATLDIAVTVGELNLDSSQAITIDGVNTLTFDNGTGASEINASAGSHEISADVSMTGNLEANLDPGTALALSGALSGFSTLTALGGGDLTLSGDLSGFAGGLIGNGGDVVVPSGTTISSLGRLNSKEGGDISITGTVTLASNASFGAGSGIQGTTGSVTVNTGGELNIGAGGGYTGIGGGDVFAQRTQSGNGTLNVNGGTVNVAAPGTNTSGAGGLDSRNLWMHPYGSGGGTSSVNLDAGLLSIARPIQRGSGGTSIFNFNGGTLQVAATSAGSMLVNMTRTNVRDGGGTIDTQGFDVTYNADILHSNIGGDSATDGGLTKLGSGRLILGGINDYNGPTTVTEGTFGVNGSLTSDVSVADGATIGGVGLTTGSLTLGTTTGASLEVDDFSPTGIEVVDLNLNGVTNLILPGGAGPFAVATYTGILTDGNGGTLPDSFSASGARLDSITDTAGLIEVSILTEVSTWTGTTSGDWQVGGPDANWTSSDTFFFNGDEVAFDDSGSIKTVTLTSDVAPTFTDIFNSAGNDYTFQGAFGITGSTDLIKDGDGVLNVLNDNSFSGVTDIIAGSVIVGNGGTSGSLGTGGIINDGALTINRSDDIPVANVISGSGPVTKAGAGSVTLTGNSSTTGAITISEGALIFAGTSSTGAAGTILVQTGGTLRFDRNDTWGNANTTATPVITVDAGGVVESNNKYTPIIDLVLNGGTLSANDGVNANFPTFGIKGTVTVNATAGGSFISTTGVGNFNEVGIGSPEPGSPNTTTFDVADGAASSDLTVSAVFSNNGGGTRGIIKTGAGTMSLTATNIYTGPTIVEAGVLSLGDGTNDSNLADGGDVDLTTGATLNLNFVGTDQVDELFIDGYAQPVGTWGRVGSGATNESALITGDGLIEVLTFAGAPEIAVEEPALTDIPSGGARDFGTVDVGLTASLTFTVRNTGSLDLNLSGVPEVDITGANAGDFSVTATPSTPVTVDGTTTFTIEFAPSATGVLVAQLSIANDDADENPFTIDLSGTGNGGTAYDTWATGSEPFDGDGNGDGVVDGIAFLLGAATPSTDARGLLPKVTESGGNLILTFSMLNAANRGTASLATQHSSDAGETDAWDAAGNQETVPEATGLVGVVNFTITPNGSLNDVVATIPGSEGAGGVLFGRLLGTQ